MGGFCGYGGSVWVMGEWAVGHWIVGILSFQKMYGLYGLKHHTVDLLSCRFLAPTDGRTKVIQEVLADLKKRRAQILLMPLFITPTDYAILTTEQQSTICGYLIYLWIFDLFVDI